MEGRTGEGSAVLIRAVWSELAAGRMRVPCGMVFPEMSSAWVELDTWPNLNAARHEHKAGKRSATLAWPKLCPMQAWRRASPWLCLTVPASPMRDE